MRPTKPPADRDIVERYLSRDESALADTQHKYGHALTALSEHITEDTCDAQECVNDTYLTAWNSIPPHTPYDYLYAFLARITRHLSLDRVKHRQRQRRSATIVELSEELEACIPAPDDREPTASDEQFGALIDTFLEHEKPLSRQIFLRRYWFMDSVAAIAGRFGISESRVKSSLYRTRTRLREYLEKEEQGK